MKNNYGVAAVTLDPATYPIGNVIHLCMYENPPEDRDIDALIEELATDEEFGMTDMEEGVDYGIMILNAETFAKIKQERGIPDEFPDTEDSEDQPAD